MYHSISAIVHGGSSPIVRIPGTEPWMIKRALDAGAHGLMVPMCDTKVRGVYTSHLDIYANEGRGRSKRKQLYELRNIPILPGNKVFVE